MNSNTTTNIKMNDSDVNNQSITMRNYKQQVAQYYQALVDTFKQIDKNNDDFIDQVELVHFLDSKMTPGKSFDRTLLSKIFEILDENKDGKISVEEFFRSYVEKQEELKIHLEGIKSHIDLESENMKRFEKLRNENKNEILNQGICKNAKFTIEILSLNMIKNSNLKKNKTLQIKMTSGTGIIQKSSFRRVEDLKFSEKFEFPVSALTLESPFYIEIFSDDVLIGTTAIPLKTIDNQEENEIGLEIQDDRGSAAFMMQAKLMLILSNYRLYQDKFNKSEREYNKYMSMREKINTALENFTEPFKFLQNVGTSAITIHVDNKNSTNTNSISGLSNVPTMDKDFSNMKYNTPEFQCADQIENVVKNTFNTPNVKWMSLILIFSSLSLIISYLNLFLKADFVNVLVPLYILVIYFTSINSNLMQNLKQFLYSLFTTLAYDLIWLIFHFSAYTTSSAATAGEDSLKTYTLMLSIIGIFVKLTLIISTWIQKLKVQRGLINRI